VMDRRVRRHPRRLVVPVIHTGRVRVVLGHVRAARVFVRLRRLRRARRRNARPCRQPAHHDHTGSPHDASLPLDPTIDRRTRSRVKQKDVSGPGGPPALCWAAMADSRGPRGQAHVSRDESALGPEAVAERGAARPAWSGSRARRRRSTGTSTPRVGRALSLGGSAALDRRADPRASREPRRLALAPDRACRSRRLLRARRPHRKTAR
jgi:hypothetical protein